MEISINRTLAQLIHDSIEQEGIIVTLSEIYVGSKVFQQEIQGSDFEMSEPKKEAWLRVREFRELLYQAVQLLDYTEQNSEEREIVYE